PGPACGPRGVLGRARGLRHAHGAPAPARRTRPGPGAAVHPGLLEARRIRPSRPRHRRGLNRTPDPGLRPGLRGSLERPLTLSSSAAVQVVALTTAPGGPEVSLPSALPLPLSAGGDPAPSPRRRWEIWRSPHDQPPWARPALLAIAAAAALLYAR